MKACQRGGAIVEFALVLPLLLLLGMITTEFGRAIYQYNTIVKSLRGAARYLSIQPQNTMTTETQNLVVYGTTSGGSTPLTYGLTTAMVTSSWSSLTGSVPPIRTVTIRVRGYRFHSMFKGAFGVIIGDANGEFTYGDITVTMRSNS